MENRSEFAFVQNMDAKIGPSLTNLVLSFIGNGQLELNVTRLIVLARPSENFYHISAFNVVMEPEGLRFSVAADLGYCFSCFELTISNEFNISLLQKTNMFPTTVISREDHAAFFQRFLQRTAQTNGLFWGSYLCDRFDVVACDGLGDSDFCPGYNLFRIIDTMSLGHTLHKHSRFHTLPPHTQWSSFKDQG